MPRARLATLAVPVTTATLALVTAGWAATGNLPLVPDDHLRALAVTAQATGPLVANDLDGSAVFSSGALAPGETKTGEVTISNAGDSAGAFTLSTTGVADTVVPAVGALSALLDLNVMDVSGTTPETVFSGKHSALSRVALGTFAPGAAHRYRFELTFPGRRPALVDNAYQGLSTSVQFDWDAVAVGGQSTTPAPVAPAPAPAPAVPVGSAGGSAATRPTGTAKTPATTAPATTAPASGTGSASAAWTVALGGAKKPVSRGRLVTWMSSTTAARAKVTGTVAFAGRTLKLEGATVKLTAKRKTVRFKLPAAAVAGPKHKLTVRLAVTATGGGHTATVRRTLRVSSR